MAGITNYEEDRKRLNKNIFHKSKPFEIEGYFIYQIRPKYTITENYFLGFGVKLGITVT